MTVIKLASTNSNPTKPVRACGTCRHMNPDSFGPTFWECGAVGMYCETARRDHNPCGSVGNLWEQAPPRKGVFTRILDWLIGES